MTENAERMLRPIPGTKIRGPRDTSGTIIKAERDGDDIWIEWDKESDSPDSLIFNEWFTDDKFTILEDGTPFDEYDTMNSVYWTSTYRFNRDNVKLDELTTVAHAIGTTIRDCVRNFCHQRMSVLDDDTLEWLDHEPYVDSTFTWGVRFRMGGDGMKAAGIHVPGGVIMTWWK